MARKETIYTVSEETNQIVRVSRTYLAAIQQAKEGEMVCTSEFQNLKKGDQMVEVVEILERF